MISHESSIELHTRHLPSGFAPRLKWELGYCTRHAILNITDVSSRHRSCPAGDVYSHGMVINSSYQAKLCLRSSVFLPVLQPKLCFATPMCLPFSFGHFAGIETGSYSVSFMRIAFGIMLTLAQMAARYICTRVPHFSSLTYHIKYRRSYWYGSKKY